MRGRIYVKNGIYTVFKQNCRYCKETNEIKWLRLGSARKM
jgi:hypothetical protein